MWGNHSHQWQSVSYQSKYCISCALCTLLASQCAHFCDICNGDWGNRMFLLGLGKYNLLPDSGGAGLHKGFQFLCVCPLVRLSVSASRSLLLHGHYTSDPKYFYRFWTSYKVTNRGTDYRWPQPPYPPYAVGGAKEFVWGVWLIEYSDPHGVKYFW